jgi:hypothetical protein
MCSTKSSWYKEVNCTDRSPSFSFPWFAHSKYLWQRLVYIGEVCMPKSQGYRNTILSSLLALATLGEETQKNDHICVALPRVAKAVRKAGIIAGFISLNFVNGYTA